ncbi:MAG: hypothetical protein EHM35_00270 [Planctomycetaceae bacterium]|nr:MAG: hypothetical protein EHM35_00270 [Planctomycetaceae bacterium]
MTATFKAIETKYHGDRFRSRKEARFAVMFRALGLAYEYEREGFDLNGSGRYLPDFFLPRPGLWVEVKGTYPTTDEWEKATALALNDKAHPVVLTWENFSDETALNNAFFWWDEDGAFHSQQGWRWLAKPELGWHAARYARFEHGESGGNGDGWLAGYDELPY